jgi:hypothetical protein
MQLPYEPTPEEVEIYEVLINRTTGRRGTEHLYGLIEDPVNKFILAWVFDMGHTQKSCETAIGLSKVAIWARIKKIKAILEKYGVTNHLLKSIDKMQL